MNILRVRCRSAEEFRGFYNTDHPEGGIFCPTTKQLAPDDEVVVEIVCKVLPNRVFVRGKVVSWRPALPRLRVRAGAPLLVDDGIHAAPDCRERRGRCRQQAV